MAWSTMRQLRTGASDILSAEHIVLSSKVAIQVTVCYTKVALIQFSSTLKIIVIPRHLISIMCTYDMAVLENKVRDFIVIVFLSTAVPMTLWDSNNTGTWYSKPHPIDPVSCSKRWTGTDVFSTTCNDVEITQWCVWLCVPKLFTKLLKFSLIYSSTSHTTPDDSQQLLPCVCCW